ncbi:hypothetical protein N5E15_02260 [Pantoea stewartii]|uniref:hypothetical protein n=1 Tax=Pantoea stewartii TaxID=66269 RepID=UPI0021D50327|nr:hypothetical protein [Pantoea stewartii]MCU7365433.1 hypothetical protein [Pantoea stewartii]
MRIKNRISHFISLLFSFCPFECMAEVIHLPVITSLTWPTSLSTKTTYSPQLMTIDDSLANQPLTKQDGLRIGYVDIVKKPYRGVMPSNNKEQYSILPLANDGEKLKDYVERVYNAGLMSGSFVLSWHSSAGVDKCQGFVLSNGASTHTATGSSVQDAWSAATAGAIFNVQPVCSQIPPAAASCHIETAEINFDFGIVTKSASTNTAISEDIYIYCTDATKVSLSEANRGIIALSNGGSVTITDDLKALDGISSMHNIPSESRRSVKLTAKITNPGKTGSFYGSSVIMLNYP